MIDIALLYKGAKTLDAAWNLLPSDALRSSA